MADPDSACPVDHKTRDAWLAHARSTESSPPKPQQQSQCPVDHSSIANTKPSWSQTISSFIWSPTSPSPTHQTANQTHPPTSTAPSNLDTSRITSTIPRSLSPSSESHPIDHGASANPSNAELESGPDSSGNWVYPSEKMFFDAMKRKGYDAREVDMKTVVPIHNAVNERAWQQIKEWEAPYLEASSCSSPKLSSFANKSTRMTPTARINTLLGYTAPFDRHDWVIDRCGTRVDYVIDFYAGRPGGTAGGPSFYLDVRPKLNTWEGVKMRAMRWTRLA